MNRLLNRPFPSIWIGLLLLLVSFALMLASIQQQSLWIDEAWTADVLYDAGRAPEGIRETLRYLLTSLQQVFDRVRADVHPPLYFVLMDGWTLLAGESELALRLPSALAGLLAAAAIAALGRLWFRPRAGWFALILLVTSGFFLQYAQEARMYALLLAMLTLALLAFAHHSKRRTKVSAALLMIALTAALYTHYVALLVYASLLLYALLMRQWRTLALLLLPALLFAPWLPFVLAQWQAHPQGAAALPLSSSIDTIAALWLLLTSGYWLNFALLFIVPALRQSRPTAITLLLLLWGVLPVIALFLLNTQGFAVLQIRYLIPVLVPWVLFLGWALDALRLPRFSALITLLMLVWLVFTQLSMREDLWHSKPRWREAVAQAVQTRNPLDPLVLHSASASPTTYYDRQYPLTQGYTLDIGWKSHTPEEITSRLDTLEAASAIWTVLPMQDPSSWDTIIQLSETRGAGYRDSVQGTIFYRFDRAGGTDLQFAFGDVALEWSPWQQERPATASLCMATGIGQQRGVRMLVTLTRGYHEVLAQVETDAAPEACLDLPETLPEETLHVRLYLLDASGQRVPLTESGFFWGDFVVLGTLTP